MQTVELCPDSVSDLLKLANLRKNPGLLPVAADLPCFCYKTVNTAGMCSDLQFQVQNSQRRTLPFPHYLNQLNAREHFIELQLHFLGIILMVLFALFDLVKMCPIPCSWNLNVIYTIPHMYRASHSYLFQNMLYSKPWPEPFKSQG